MSRKFDGTKNVITLDDRIKLLENKNKHWALAIKSHVVLDNYSALVFDVLDDILAKIGPIVDMRVEIDTQGLGG